MAVVIRGDVVGGNITGSRGPVFECDETDKTAAIILMSLGALGIGANIALMAVILVQKPLRR